MEKAVLGGGCFWCTEAIFVRLKGVSSVKPGYTGGHVENPTYKEVCDGTTGHAEVIEIEFDDSEISFVELMDIFFQTHDPTTLNRQGADVGTQYRSAIFWQSDEEREQAEQFIQQLNENKAFPNPVVTQVSEPAVFYSAENYHHDYFQLNPGQPYCMAVISPKVDKFQSMFADKIK